jgi:hypothetical protein
LDLVAIFFVNLFSCVVIHLCFLLLPVVWAFPVTKIRFFSLSCCIIKPFLEVISYFYTKYKEKRVKNAVTSRQEVDFLTSNAKVCVGINKNRKEPPCQYVGAFGPYKLQGRYFFL